MATPIVEADEKARKSKKARSAKAKIAKKAKEESPAKLAAKGQRKLMAFLNHMTKVGGAYKVAAEEIRAKIKEGKVGFPDSQKLAARIMAKHVTK